MFNTQRDIVVCIHHTLMNTQAETNVALAMLEAVKAYALEHEVEEVLACYA
jgi:hypothetical protein